ncbi:hypothetical protein [Pelagibacterium sp. H642]|uniref:hypothetical protein n=1 Tax=Pelagibacterium sp. H642 TaxID=1881069 RepID=UPI0028161248|nr:hypothetical protein [Pelagibacterium sp. H642]WMT92617.1 hypothetical protein NO934_19925 [Pelagibacterium sp. H642]
MKNRKLSIAVAALLLGLQLGSPVSAQVTEDELTLVELYVANEQVEELALLLETNPELLELPGSLGDALRAFWAAPSLASLQLVAQLIDERVVLQAQLAEDEDDGDSIY